MNSGATLHDLGPVITANGIAYTVWAPEREQVDIVVRTLPINRVISLTKTEGGYFIGTDLQGHVGDLYTVTIDGKENLPDLASRFQPEGLSGPSVSVNPSVYQWKAWNWKRPAWGGQIIYELHIGTFTRAGTYPAAMEKLEHLASLGINAIEIMPLAECTGERNWGYDGALLFAPYHPYGTPDELRAFIDACHEYDIAVILDIVYNHIGAIGDITDFYSKFLSREKDDGAWGKSFNLDGENSAPVRHLILQNIRYWLDDFRVDGIRLDATHAIHDTSARHLVAEIAELIHSRGAFVIAEDDRNDANLIKPNSEGGWELDALWADDFHHAFRVFQTGENHSYYDRYAGTISEIAETLHHGWLFRGQDHPKLKKPRGTPCDHLAPKNFVYCISNHDQVGNRPFGERLHQLISLEAYRALSLFFCFVPYTPMLFMGQEWGADSPFLFFTDHPGDFGRLVTEGRNREFKFNAKEHGRPLPDCQASATFVDSKLKWEECRIESHRQILTLYREALRIRRSFFGGTNPPRAAWDVQALSDRLVLRYRWSKSQLDVVLLKSGRESLGLISGSQILMRSSDECFGSFTNLSAPDTVIMSSAEPAEK